MRNLAFRHIVVLTATVFAGLLAADTQGQNITRDGSGVEAILESLAERHGLSAVSFDVTSRLERW